MPQERIGVKDMFGEVGPIDYLAKRFEMTAYDIVEKARKLLKRKNEKKV
jgi:transketolase